MIRAEASGIVKAKPEVVFDYLLDGRKIPEWSPKMASSVEQLTKGAVADGTRYRGQFKGMGLVEWVMAEVKRPTSFVHLSTPKMAMVKHTWMFAPEGSDTRFTNVIEGKPRGIYWLLYPMMKRMMGKRSRDVVSEVQAKFGR